MLKFPHLDAREKVVWFMVAVCSAILLFSFVARFSIRMLWDDAYMFARYAENFLASGVIAWNPGGEPTYGLTSLLYFAVIVPLYVLTQHNPGLTMWSGSVIFAAIFFVLLFKLAMRPARDNPRVRLFIITLFFFTLANSANRFMPHVTTGMDTMFALAYLTAYLMLVARQHDAPSRVNLITASVWGGLAYWVRPDLLVFTLGIPAIIFLLDSNRATKRDGLVMLGIAGVLTLAQLGVATLYFGTLVPLPFYAKALRLYGDSVSAEFATQGLTQFMFFLGGYGFLIFIAALPMFYDFKRWWQATPAWHKGLIATSLCFILYYVVVPLQIMGLFGRFYFPTLPILIFLAAQSIVILVEWLPREILDAIQTMSARIWTSVVLGLLVFVAHVPISEIGMFRDMLTTNYIGAFDLREFYPRSFAAHYWYRLDAFAALPQPLTFATTEVGYIGALARRDTIVDLAGLNTDDFAHPPFRADMLFQKYKPDVIYLPHPHYEEMTAAILNDPTFKANYDYWDAKSLNAFMGVAIARTSPQYSALKKIIEQGPLSASQ